MVNQALFDVVKNQLASGVSDVEVKEFLHRRGTSESDIRELFDVIALQSVTTREVPVAVQTPEPVAPTAAPATEPIPAQTQAHGIVRDIPPLQPSMPFNAAPAVPQTVVAQSSMPGVAPQIVVEAEEIVGDPDKRKRLIIAGGSIVASIALLFGISFIYSSFFASPDQVMDTMMSRLRDVRSGEFSTDITVVTSSMDELATTSASANPFLSAFAISGPVTIAVHATGTVDVRDEQKPKIAIALTTTMDKWPMGDFLLDAEYRNINRTNYLKINNVPDLGFLNLGSLKSQWFMAADQAARAQLGDTTDGASPDVIPDISQDQRDRLAATWKASRFLAVSEVLGSEDVDGVSTHHYKLTLDKDLFKKWSIETSSILSKTNTASDMAALDEDLSLATIHDLEIWIGRFDGLPHKVVAKVTLQDKLDPSKTSDITLAIGGDKFNSATDIAAPEGSKSFEDALRDIFGQMLGGVGQKPTPTTLRARNDRRKSDVALIADAIKKNIVAHSGSFTCAAGPLPMTATFMGTAGFGMHGYMIEPCLVPTYLSVMPHDPSKGSSTMSGYSVFSDQQTRRITVRAPYAEGGQKSA